MIHKGDLNPNGFAKTDVARVARLDSLSRERTGRRKCRSVECGELGLE